MSIEEQLCQYDQERRHCMQATHCLTGEWWQKHLTVSHFDVEKCAINISVLKLSSAVTTHELFSVMLSYSSLMLYFTLCCMSVYFPSGFRLWFYFSKGCLSWFPTLHPSTSPPIMRLGWEWSLQCWWLFISTNLLFCWLALTYHSLCSYFRWPVLHMGAKQLWSAGLGQRMSLPSQSTTCQVSWWDPFGSGCCRWSPQFCPLSLRSCVWLGEEQLRTAGTKWWTRY